MLTTLIALCTLAPAPLSAGPFNPLWSPQGYQPIVKTGGVESGPAGDGSSTGPVRRAAWYTQTVQRVEVRPGSTGLPLPYEVVLKFESVSQILGIAPKDVIRKVSFTKSDDLVKLDYTTTSVPDSLTLVAYINDVKIQTLLVGIYKGVAGAGAGGS